ncbi:MAG: FeoB-associated Cys-rich membrane protein [Eubacterium sp.]
MPEFLSENIGTIIVCLVVVAIVGLVIAKLVKDKKQGKSSCGCSCANCPSAGMCHKK